ncbi:MAG: hypothetical protein NTV70_07370 [Acidobacteria bacterium]|nr:hypothetical protein [Acidobacteriota bacterium]
MHIKPLRYLIAVAALAGTALYGQPFSSGSTGSDGAYSPTVSGDFEIGSLNAAGDNVFHFTTINIPAGVTIRLKGSKLRNKAVTWLASGAVTIAGTLDLSGASAIDFNTNSGAPAISAARVPPDPGPGGYTGGLGLRGGVAPEPGAGPGGGPGGTGSSLYACMGGPGSFIWPGPGTTSGIVVGPTYGSYLAIPLYGGSGGGGGNGATNSVGGVGGAGGGAIRIISSTTITVSGVINANGGTGSSPGGSIGGCQGGPGTGGTIHLVAPTIAGGGQMTVQSGSHPYGATFTGLIRLSADTFSYTGIPSEGTTQGRRVHGPLFVPPANSTLAEPSVRITQINGAAVPTSPKGEYLRPDVIINASTPVTVNVEAKNMPLTAAVKLRVTSETAGDQLVDCVALSGSSATSTTTCSATFPFSISISALRATW